MSTIESPVEQPAQGFLSRRREKRAAKKAMKRELPYPAGISPLRHPLRWSFGLTKSISSKAVLTYIGTLAAATIYWMFFQTTDFMKGHWDYYWVTDSVTRHLYRAAMEAAAAGFIVRVVGYNHYKAAKKPMGKFKRFVVKRLHISQPGDGETMGLGGAFWALAVWFMLASAISVGIVTVLTQSFGISLAQDTVGAQLTANPTFVERMQYSVAQIINNWPLKLVVFAVFLSTSWIIKGIADDVQVFAVQWLRQRGYRLNSRIAKLFYPDPFLARFNEICAQRKDELTEFSGGSTIGIKATFAVLTVFAIVGWFAVNGKLPHANPKPPAALTTSAR
jgi:hypothetical protein